VKWTNYSYLLFFNFCFFNSADTVADVQASADVATNSKGVKYLVIKNIRAKIRVGDQNSKIINKDKNSNNALISKYIFLGLFK
jgi:hypothetical protein